MTKPKPPYYKAKMGRKTKQDKKWLDKMLKMLYDTGDLTPQQTSLYAKCGYDYASKKFQEFDINRYRIRQKYLQACPQDDSLVNSQNVEDFLIKHLGKSRYFKFGLREIIFK